MFLFRAAWAKYNIALSKRPIVTKSLTRSWAVDTRTTETAHKATYIFTLPRLHVGLCNLLNFPLFPINSGMVMVIGDTVAQCIERNDAAENKPTAHDFGRTLLMGAFSMSVQGPCYHLWTTTLQRLAARWQPIYVRPFARKHLPRHIVTQSRDQPLY